MNLLMVTPVYYPHIGGMEYVVKSISENLTRLGHDVTVLTGDFNLNSSINTKINQVKVIRWPTTAPSDAYHFPKYREELKKVLSKILISVDIVHIHSIHTIYSMYLLKNICRLIKPNQKINIVLTPYYHGTGHTIVRRMLWTGWRRFVKKLMVECVKTVHTVSKIEAYMVKRDFNINAIPIENGVEEWILSTEWRPGNYAMYSGRIEKYKNIHRFARLIKILNDYYGYNLNLKIYGKGPFKEKLDHYLSKINVNYEINDPLPYTLYIKTMASAFIFGLLSEKESYPQSINEANAIGVPVIIAKPWGYNFSNRKRTLIVELGLDDLKLVEKIHKFINDAPKENPSKVPSWKDVTKFYINEIYKS